MISSSFNKATAVAKQSGVHSHTFIESQEGSQVVAGINRNRGFIGEEDNGVACKLYCHGNVPQLAEI